MKDQVSATSGSDNVFADLGFENPDEELLKAKLVREIRAVIAKRRLTQESAAVLIGLKQPDVSALVNGRTERFTLDRLVRCLGKFDCTVDIVVRRKRRSRTEVEAA